MTTNSVSYGSDLTVAILDRLGIEYVSLNPGASFRGLHESLVAGGQIETITCLFEGTTVALAHGYAKAAGRPMAALVHNLVGLQHAAMAMFNAHVDGVPVLVIGGAGPTDRSRRRPWIDWVHSPWTQGMTVRPFTRYEAQPISLAEFPEVFARAFDLAVGAIPGPSYVAVDAILQEQGIGEWPDLGMLRSEPPSPLPADPNELEVVATALAKAESPLIVADYSGKSQEGYEALIHIAEHLAIPVVDLGGRHSFPNTHWADATLRRTQALEEADVILCLDPRDTRWAVTGIDQKSRSWIPLTDPDAEVFVISMSRLRQNSFLETEGVFRSQLEITADTASALPALASLISEHPPASPDRRERLHEESRDMLGAASNYPADSTTLTEGHAIASVHEAVRDGPWRLAFTGFRDWVRRTWKLERWNAHLGISGGAGLGYGPGAAVGAALGYRDEDSLVVTIQPDGDLLYNPMALWTAAHHHLPMLMAVLDNGTYGADRVHQARMAQYRGGRSASRAHIGVDFDDPRIDIAGLAESQGVRAWTVTQPRDLHRVREAVAYIRDEHLPALVTLRTPKPEVSGLG